MTGSLYKSLECDECNESYETNVLQSYCKNCNAPLDAKYHLMRSKPSDVIEEDNFTLWRYKKLLPILDDSNIVSLGEGWTPIRKLDQLSNELTLENHLMMKDEAYNPTGSFKARGMSVAVSKAKEFGVESCCTPTAGNAGSALAAYSAKAKMKAEIYMPILTPKMFAYDTEVMGAKVHYVDGSIRDAGLQMQKENINGGMWDVSTMKEPFRLEGKKTLGYEIAEQLNWQLPDVIFYPTGGGTGLIGIWKSFKEMLQMGWIKDIPTKMVAVQMSGCDPIVKAFEENQSLSKLCENPSPTAANGLRVPKAFADKSILRAIYESKGFALRVEENEMIDAISYISKKEGHFLSPEGAALFVAIKKSLESNLIKKEDKVLFINTGSGYKYVENLW